MPFNHRDIWDTKYLKSNLVARTVSEKKAFVYFFAIIGFDWIQYSFFRLSASARPIESWERTDIFLTLTLTLFGILFLFWCNGGSRGKDFLHRYFSLSFVVGWKFMALAVAAMWLLAFALQNSTASIAGWASTATLAIINFGMFMRIGFHLRGIAHVSED